MEAPGGISAGGVQGPSEPTLKEPTIKTELITWKNKTKKKRHNGAFFWPRTVFGGLPQKKPVVGLFCFEFHSSSHPVDKESSFYESHLMLKGLFKTCVNSLWGLWEEPSKFGLNDRKLSFSVNKLLCQIPSKKSVWHLSLEPGAGLRTDGTLFPHCLDIKISYYWAKDTVRL